jgi:hypothetical protein
MKYTVRQSVIDVVGRIWMPAAVCSLRITMSAHDVENARDDDGKITRESIEQWLMTHSGDFSQVMDFRASIEDGEETVEIPFASEAGEVAYMDTIAEEA